MERYRMRFSPAAASGEPIPIGAGANGDEIGATAHHLLRGGRAWYPVMGEFHFSRYPADEWETELRKIKAGGVTVVATYVFWIHHEEDRGVWRSDGNLDLRRFLTLCQRVGLEVLLRIGPWAHGECRNGGFPDWLAHDESIAARTDDPAYLALVRGLYAHIFDMARGLLLKDGGPVIGVQLENEHGHCGGESGGQGLAHMCTLKRIAQECGFLVPLYTATGWGGGNVAQGEMLPVMGGYADAPWEASLEALPASRNFLLLPLLNDSLIASDWGHRDDSFTFCVEQNPFLTAELGGGVQCTFHRRPLIRAEDTAAQALCKLGTGANLLGYYMFHGGTHPVGRHSTLQESTRSGSLTDVPVRSYDFQAPLGEFGDPHDSFYALKALHMLIADANVELAGSVYVSAPNPVHDAENLDDLRFSVRWNAQTREGFLFINNHQRLRSMRAHTDVRFTIEADGEVFELPPMDIPTDFYGVLPFNLRVGARRLRTTSAQLLCRLGDLPVLYAWPGQKPEVCFDGDFLLLSREEALHAWRVGESLYLAPGCLMEEEGGLVLLTDEPRAHVRRLPDGASREIEAEPVRVEASLREFSRNGECASYRVTIGEVPAARVEDVLLALDFTGDHAEAYLDGALIADWYTTGQPWRMALKRFGYPRELEVRVYPVTRPTYFEIPTPVGMRLDAVSAVPRYRMNVRL